MEIKNIIIDGNKFIIKYLTSIENYQLEISNGKISINVFYIPEFSTSIRKSEEIINKYYQEIKEKINTLINENNDFYRNFESDLNHTQFSYSGYRNKYGEIISQYSSVTLILNSRMLPKTA